MICLGCQRGFQGTPQEDSFEAHQKKLKELEEKKLQIEISLQENETVTKYSKKKRKKKKLNTKVPKK